MLQCSSRGFTASARLYEDINSPEVFLLEYCEVSSGICSYQSHTLPFLISGPFSPSGFEESLGFAWTWILWWWVENYLYINRHAYWTNKAIYCLTGLDTGTRWCWGSGMLWFLGSCVQSCLGWGGGMGHSSSHGEATLNLPPSSQHINPAVKCWVISWGSIPAPFNTLNIPAAAFC